MKRATVAKWLGPRPTRNQAALVYGLPIGVMIGVVTNALGPIGFLASIGVAIGIGVAWGLLVVLCRIMLDRSRRLRA